MPKNNTLLTYGRYGALGFEFAGAVVAGIFLGRYLDGVFETTPLLMVLGAAGGMAGALYRLVIVLQHLSRPQNNADNAHDNRED
jgi:F0F1-type ATP synthase assembly protein I